MSMSPWSTGRSLLKISLVIIIASYSQVSWSLHLPEHGVYKSYENCLISSQGDLWVRMLRNFFPDKGDVKLAEERAFFQGISRPTIGRNHIDIKYRAIFENDLLPSSVGLDFRYEPKDGSLKLTFRRHQNAQPIELEEIKIPFFKYDDEDTDLEILNRFGEVDEHTITLAKEVQSYSYENSAPVTFKNKRPSARSPIVRVTCFSSIVPNILPVLKSRPPKVPSHTPSQKWMDIMKIVLNTSEA